MQKLRSSELFLLLTVFRFFEDGELWFLCGGFSAGLADFKKMLHGVWGRELPQDKSAQHTIRLWLCALTDRREMRNYASAVKKLSAWVFFFERGERFFTALAPRHALCRV